MWERKNYEGSKLCWYVKETFKENWVIDPGSPESVSKASSKTKQTHRICSRPYKSSKWIIEK